MNSYGNDNSQQQQHQYQYQYHHPHVEEQQQCLPGQHKCYGTGMHVSMPLKCLDRQFVW